MARCLLIGCGCRGCDLARELVRRGHAVRGTTRRPEWEPEIESTGADAVVADPDRVATMIGALRDVSIVYLLLGSAAGDPDHLTALHSTRLEMLLGRLVDSPVRGLVYECAGTVDRSVLAGGAARVGSMCERSRIPHALLAVAPAQRQGWLEAAVRAGEELMGPGALDSSKRK